MTEPSEPTLRDHLLKQLDGQELTASHRLILEAFNTSGAARSLLGLSNRLNGAAFEILAQSKPNASFEIAALAASMASDRFQPRPVPEFYTRLLGDQKFQRAQRQFVHDLLNERRPPIFPVGTALAAARALRGTGGVAAAAQVTNAVADGSTEAPAAYGSKQLTFGQTAALAPVLWSIVQIHLQRGTDKNLVETYLVTLFLLVLIWTTLAAAP